MATLHKIEWLLENAPPSSEIHTGIKKIQFPYPPDLATGYSEHIELHDDIVIIKDIHQFKTKGLPLEIPLGQFHVEFPSNTFIVQMMHAGHIDYFNENRIYYSKRVPGNDLFARYKSTFVEQILFTKEDISLSVISISESQLISILGTELSELLYKNLGLLNNPAHAEFKIPKTISNKINNCALDALDGKMRSLLGQTMVLQYLLELNLYISSSKKFLNDLHKLKFNVEDLHAELLQITVEVPKLIDLAKKYNVSPNKLNQAFIKKYNQSIYSFISIQRLDQAFLALRETDVPMKILANKIGYSHVNHFITAFTKKFGTTPGSVRKQIHWALFTHGSKWKQANLAFDWVK